jgi:hypothetical protein
MDGPPYEIEQAGPRKLVEEVQDAYRWWTQQGQPRVEDWTITVTPTGQRIELRPSEAGASDRTSEDHRHMSA